MKPAKRKPSAREVACKLVLKTLGCDPVILVSRAYRDDYRQVLADRIARAIAAARRQGGGR